MADPKKAPDVPFEFPGPVPIRYEDHQTTAIEASLAARRGGVGPSDTAFEAKTGRPRRRLKQRGRESYAATEFDPAQHPRSRTGEWVKDDQSPEAHAARAKKRKPKPRKPLPPKPLPQPALAPPPIAPDIAQISNAEQADAYLATHLGIDALLTSGPDAQPGQILPPTFYQHVVQAISDAASQFPVLLGGPYRLDGIYMSSSIPVPLSDEYLATLRGPEALANTILWMYPGHTAIVFNDVAGSLRSGIVDHAAGTPGGYVSDASRYAYGRTMHELGHAVAEAAGFGLEQAEPAEAMWQRTVPALAAAGLTPEVARRISPYGATAPEEMWAEAFSLLHTPGAMEHLARRYPEGAAAVLRLQEQSGTYNGQRIL